MRDYSHGVQCAGDCCFFRLDRPLTIAFLTYLLIVSLLRHQRARKLEKRYSPAGKASFGRMTGNDAQAILKDLTELEFPKIFGFSIIFALFKVRKSESVFLSNLYEHICYRHTVSQVFPLYLWPLGSLQM